MIASRNPPSGCIDPPTTSNPLLCLVRSNASFCPVLNLLVMYPAPKPNDVSRSPPAKSSRSSNGSTLAATARDPRPARPFNPILIAPPRVGDGRGLSRADGPGETKFYIIRLDG